MDYFEELFVKMRAKVEASRIARAEHAICVAKQEHEAARPLVDRVAEVIATLTLDDQEAGIRLEEIAEKIPGKHIGHAQPKAVGEALRKLGYERKRCWRKPEQGFRSTWHKSTTAPQE
jgi:hypothetical protein